MSSLVRCSPLVRVSTPIVSSLCIFSLLRVCFLSVCPLYECLLSPCMYPLRVCSLSHFCAIPVSCSPLTVYIRPKVCPSLPYMPPFRVCSLTFLRIVSVSCSPLTVYLSPLYVSPHSVSVPSVPFWRIHLFCLCPLFINILFSCVSSLHGYLLSSWWWCKLMGELIFSSLASTNLAPVRIRGIIDGSISDWVFSTEVFSSGHL